MKIKTSDVQEFLAERGVGPVAEEEVPFGIELRAPDGEIFRVFKSGKLAIQGPNTSLSKEARARFLGEAPTGPAAPPFVHDKPVAPVFIVYGHDTAARDALELLLRRMGLDPIVLANIPAAGDTIIEKLEQYLGQEGAVGFACVLLTPDDEGRQAGTEKLHYRARQNVILELGMVLARIGRKRVAILHKKSVELPSDIGGLIYIGFEERVEEVSKDIYRNLIEAGYKPKPDGL